MNRKCLVCGGDLIQRAHESRRRFSGKRYCSAKCARADMQKRGQGWWGEKRRQLGEEWEDSVWWKKALVRIDQIVAEDRRKRGEP